MVAGSPAFAASYSGNAYTSATNAIQVQAVPSSVTTGIYYVDNAAGTASNPSGTGIDAPVSLLKTSGWNFDFTNPTAVTFSGYLALGDYKTQVKTTGASSSDGRQSYYGVNHLFSGVGTYDEATNTFSYVKVAGASNSGGGSSYEASAPALCVNGASTPAVNVCVRFNAATREWEGLALSFVFSEDRSSFSGALTGYEKSGVNIALNTTVLNWTVTAVETVPVPAAAWLFGSALLGMAGVRARRR
jgi:hypothetical protein